MSGPGLFDQWGAGRLVDQRSALLRDSGASVGELRFWVSGVPIPQGSLKPIPVPGPDGIRTNRVYMKNSDDRLLPWREDVRQAALAQLRLRPMGFVGLLGGPLLLEAQFFLPRKGVHRKKVGPAICAKRPDLDKLLRAVNDALTGTLYYDDGQITDIFCSKRIASLEDPRTGVMIRVTPLVG